MPAELSFVAALMVGLLGSSHCLGMCGGIASAFNLGGGIDSSPAQASIALINRFRNTCWI